jgi:hypothetical protein
LDFKSFFIIFKEKNMYRIKVFFRQCYNVIRWLPVIWRDRDWDHHYFNEILIKKLEHKRDFFLSDRTHLARAKETAEQIQTAINMLHQTRDSWEFYDCVVLQELDAKWGEGVVRFEPIPGTDSSEMHIDHDGVKTKEDKDQYAKEFAKLSNEASKRYKHDKRSAYKYLADHIDYWWD